MRLQALVSVLALSIVTGRRSQEQGVLEDVSEDVLAITSGVPRDARVLLLTQNLGARACRSALGLDVPQGAQLPDVDTRAAALWENVLKQQVPPADLLQVEAATAVSDYPYDAVVFSSQEGASTADGDDVLYELVKLALKIPDGFRAQTQTKEASVLIDKWSYRGRQTIWYRDTTMSLVGHGHSKFIGQGGKIFAKHFILQTLRFDVATGTRCDVDIVSTHLPMTSDETSGGRNGLQHRLDALEALDEWRRQGNMNGAANRVDGSDAVHSTDSSINAAILSGDLNFRVDAEGEQLQVAIASKLHSQIHTQQPMSGGMSWWQEPSPPSTYTCRYSTRSDREEAEFFRTAFPQASAEKQAKYKRKHNGEGPANPPSVGEYKQCRNGDASFAVDAAAEGVGVPFYTANQLAPYKLRQASCAFDKKSASKPFSYCDRVVVRQNSIPPTSPSACNNWFTAKYESYKSFLMCDNSDHNAVLAVLQISWVQKVGENRPSAVSNAAVDSVPSNILSSELSRQLAIVINEVAVAGRWYMAPGTSRFWTRYNLKIRCKTAPSASSVKLFLAWDDKREQQGVGAIAHVPDAAVCANCPRFFGFGASECICAPVTRIDDSGKSLPIDNVLLRFKGSKEDGIAAMATAYAEARDKCIAARTAQAPVSSVARTTETVPLLGRTDDTLSSKTQPPSSKKLDAGSGMFGPSSRTSSSQYSDSRSRSADSPADLDFGGGGGDE